MSFEISGLKSISSWIELIRDTNSTLHKKLHQIYADNNDLRLEATEMCLCTLEAFAERYAADRSVLVIRSTGRVNLLGTHIDHRGGSVNPMTIKHMWLVVEPRDDDLVLAKNIESNDFPDEQFSISQCLPAGEKVENWDTWCHDEFEKRKHDPSISWSNYIRAAVLYLQHLNTKDDGSFAPALKGMNMMVYGNIPRAAGLSSSSALVMITAEAVIRINSLDIKPADFVEHWGFAEWYVGTRGGCSDHAAIIYGRPHTILHITAFPLSVNEASLPAGYCFVLANSDIKAKKQAITITLLLLSITNLENIFHFAAFLSLSKFNINDRVGASIIAEIKQKRIPIAHPKPKITIGDILDIIKEANPMIVVIVESKIAFPVDLIILSILSTILSIDFSSTNLFII